MVVGSNVIIPRNATKSTNITVDVECITQSFACIKALDNVSLQVVEGEFLTLLGASGSGKSTLLRVICGFTTPDGGRILIHGEDVTRWPVQKRGLGLVFQNYALFPHLSVEENVAYALQIRKISKSETQERVKRALERVNLQQFATRYPAQMSGGQQQRVAVARALVYEPTVLLMDEPLGALDRKLRKQVQVELRQLQRDLGITFINVTHDQEEALSMSDRIAVMRDGRIEQLDTPVALYRHPVSEFVADFVGATNFFDASLEAVSSDRARLTMLGRSFDLPMQTHGFKERAAVCRAGIRPELIRFTNTDSYDVRIEAQVVDEVFAGNTVTLICRAPDGQIFDLETAGCSEGIPAKGESLMVGWNAQDMNIFNQKGNKV